MKATPDGTSWRVSFQLSAFSGQLLAFLAALVEFRREVVDRARGLGGLQVLQKGLPIGIAAFLAQFELALQQLDLHLKADDAADQAVGVTLGQLGEVVAGAGALKLGDELRQQAVQGFRIADGLEPAGGVHHGEVPGGHGFRFVVPGWRDVTVRTAKHDYGLLAAIKTLALEVLARYVSEERAVGRSGSIEDGRGATRKGERLGSDESVNLKTAVD